MEAANSLNLCQFYEGFLSKDDNFHIYFDVSWGSFNLGCWCFPVDVVNITKTQGHYLQFNIVLRKWWYILL